MTLFKNTKKKIKYGLKKAAINIKHFLKLPTNKNDININKTKKPSFVGAEEYNNIVGEKNIDVINKRIVFFS